MRRLLLIALLVSMPIMIMEPQSITAESGEVWVPYDYLAIQEAINAAGSGDTIYVMGGPYYEHVVINKSLSLVGKGSYVAINGKDNGNVLNVTASNVTVAGFNITNSGWPNSGIYLSNVNNCRIFNNTLLANTLGVYLQDSYGNTISGNWIDNNAGITLSNSSLNTISGNNIIANDHFGISLEYSSGNRISANNIISNGIGLGFSSCSNNTILRNNITENIHGIVLTNLSNNNTLYRNDLKANNIGFQLYECANNTFYHNNMINNTNNQLTASSGNKWDFGWPIGGNYWNNHRGTDEYNGHFQDQLGSDGIHDSPFNLEIGNVDRYPLYAPITVFDVEYDLKQYEIAVISNSSISAFQLKLVQKILSFNVTGETGIGFCRVNMPNTVVSGMWENNYIVLVNNKETPFSNWTDGSQSYIHFTYQHSEKEVLIIIPESPKFLILPLFMIATLVILKIYNRKREG